MYPAGNLKLLSARKALLRERIGRQRDACAVVCHRLAGTLEKIDAWRDRLRRARSYAPWALTLLGLWRRRRAAPRAEPPQESWGGRLSRWMPVVLQGVQMFRQNGNGNGK